MGFIRSCLIFRIHPFNLAKSFILKRGVIPLNKGAINFARVLINKLQQSCSRKRIYYLEQEFDKK